MPGQDPNYATPSGKQNSPVKPRVPCGEPVSHPWIPESKLPPITKNPIKSIVRNILLTNPLFPRFYADVVIASAPNSNEAKILASNYQKIIDRTSMPNTRTCTHIKVTGSPRLQKTRREERRRKADRATTKAGSKTAKAAPPVAPFDGWE